MGIFSESVIDTEKPRRYQLYGIETLIPEKDQYHQIYSGGL